MIDYFKLTKKDRYIDVEYIEYKPANITIDVNLKSGVYVNDMEEANRLMENTLVLKGYITVRMEKLGHKHSPERVIAESIKMIDSWNSGIMLISKFTLEEMGDYIIQSYHKQYDDAFIESVKLLNSTIAKPINYLENYQICDRYNYNNKYWELGLRELEQGPGHLDKISDLLDELGDLTSQLKEKTK